MNEVSPEMDSQQAIAAMAFQQLIIKMAGSMTFMAILTIIYGAFACLSIIGAVLGVPFIFAGIRLKEAAEGFKAYAQMNDIQSLQRAIDRQERYFFICKVLAIIGLCFFALYIILIILLVLSGSSLMNEFN